MRAEARARLCSGWRRPAPSSACRRRRSRRPAKGLSLTALEPSAGASPCLAAHGGLTGAPQVSLPGATVDGRPIGLSIVGGRGTMLLVATARALEDQPMNDVTLNIPEVVAEVRAHFERYEQALIDKDVAVLDATFWDSPHTIRYALSENGYGFSEIHAHRVARPPGPGIKDRRIRLEILTLGRDLATVNLEFKVRGRELIGRQSQTWVRFPGLGWKVITAHVSTVSEKPFW